MLINDFDAKNRNRRNAISFFTCWPNTLKKGIVVTLFRLFVCVCVAGAVHGRGWCSVWVAGVRGQLGEIRRRNFEQCERPAWRN